MPPAQIDLGTLPPPVLGSEPGSFARYTLEVRLPRIVEETIELNAFPHDIRSALQELKAEVLDGSIRRLHETTPDQAFWELASQPYIGHQWLEAPWYWAEVFFYRRILEATRYFQPRDASGQPSPWHHFDPYTARKQTEWEPHAGPRVVGAILEDLSPAPYARFEGLLHASLWGNRADLTHNIANQVGSLAQLERERSKLLVDDTRPTWELLRQKPPGGLVIITDNAGTELLADLALADFILQQGLAEQISLHLKPQPFFVSDAMPADVLAGLQALERGGGAARALAQQVQVHLDSQRLQLVTHWFYATSLFYFQLPADLMDELSAAGLVILKGDVNYRRLLGDAHWPPTTSFEGVTAYFPAPLLALRTLKAELIVGLWPGQAEALQAGDPHWLVNGQRGLIQGRLWR